jgi:hypothetical protein
MAIVTTRQMTGGSLFAFKIVSEPAAVHIVPVMVNAVVVHIRDAVGGKEVRAGITDFLRTRLLVTMSGDGFLHFSTPAIRFTEDTRPATCLFLAPSRITFASSLAA